MDPSVARLIEDLQRRLLDQIRPFVGIGLVLTMAVAAGEIARGRLTFWVVLQPASMLVMWAAFRFVKSPFWLGTVQGAGILAMSTAALFHFGPMLGTGAFFALAISIISFLLGKRAMFVGLAYFATIGVIAAVSAAFGWKPRWFPGELATSDWFRIITASALNLLCLGLLFEAVQVSMRTALANEVAARKRQEDAEEQRERALTAAMTAQKLETVGRLAGGVAHDFNNRLAVIHGVLEAMHGATAAERDALAAEGLVAVRGATQTARRLLGLANRSAAEVGVSNPIHAIESVVTAMARVVPETVRLETDCSPGTTGVAIAQNALEEVLLNLIVNARDAFAGAERGRGRIVIGCKNVGDRVVISVTDDGPGMTETVRARAFEPFFTTKPQGEGTGLGLAQVERLVHHANGTIELKSELGAGASFHIELPSVARPVTSVPPEADLLSPAARARLLVVEDDPAVRRLLDRVLKKAGHDVTTVGDVAAAKAELASGTYDLLVSDGQLPDGNASDVLAAYRSGRPEAPAIVCTGYLDDPFVLRLRELDRLEIIGKPFESRALVDVVARLVKQL